MKARPGAHWHLWRLRQWWRYGAPWRAIALGLAAVVAALLCVIVELLRYIALSG